MTILGSLVMRFANDFHSWLRHSWTLLANRLTRDPKIVIHGNSCIILYIHDDIMKWKHFPRYWPFVRRIHRSPVNFTHKGQLRGALMFSLICVWINSCVNNCEVGDWRRQSRSLWSHCNVPGLTYVMITVPILWHAKSVFRLAAVHFNNWTRMLSDETRQKRIVTIEYVQSKNELT